MRLSLCTITFRHHLVSIEQLAYWARNHYFQGIELWGVHAKNLLREPEYGADWLDSLGLYISMVSDYLSLDGSVSQLTDEVDQLCKIAAHWRTHKLRTFAGTLSSAQTPRSERARLVERLRLACELAADRGCLLLVETHPNTLADTLDSTKRLLAEVDHPALAINLDVLHLWEAGDDPAHAFRQLQPHVAHFHLKNISSRRWLSVFAPSNVYAAAGCRRGMVPLFDGAFDYETFLLSLTANASIEASLEWFGDHVHEVLDGDAMKIERISRHMPRRRAPPAVVLPRAR